jgi:mannose-6-phosphate isomerase-like protein (cupin superfamily)
MTQNTVERIMYDSELIAIIIPKDYEKDGIEFFTPDEFSQQIAYMKHPAGKSIPAHMHNNIPREVFYTLETLFIKSGRVKVDFYSMDKKAIGSRTLTSGDTLFLASGGHGFTMLEATEMIEVKQGPYGGDQDKVRF